MRDKGFEVFIVGVGFKAKSVFQGYSKCDDKVQSGQFGKQICFALVKILLVPLLSVDPDKVGHKA